MGKRRIVRGRFPATAARASRRMRRRRLRGLPPRRPPKRTVRRDQQLARVWLTASLVLLPAGQNDRLTNDRPKQMFLQSANVAKMARACPAIRKKTIIEILLAEICGR